MHTRLFVVFALICSIAAATLDNHAIEVVGGLYQNPQECHQLRYERARDMRWPWPLDHYHMADEVATRIWVGSVCAAMDTDFLKERNISLVISMADEWRFTGTREGITYMSAPDLHDSSSDDPSLLLQRLEEVYTRVTADSRHVLIYCNMGISRSATAAIYTIMRSERNTFESVLDSVQMKRPIISPNALYRSILARQTFHAEL
jgi:hypothetical protein